MGKFIDITGQIIGHRKVIKYVGRSLWECECLLCGKIHNVGGYAIRHDRALSCGCQNRYPEGIAARNKILALYKWGARKRQLEWAITDEQFFSFLIQNCYFCAAAPEHEMKVNEGTGSYFYNGVDRLDNNVGYLMYNLVTCCGTCNRAKQCMKLQQFLEWIEKVYNHRVTKERPSETSSATVDKLDQRLSQQRTFVSLPS